jgi:hypothetical protein
VPDYDFPILQQEIDELGAEKIPNPDPIGNDKKKLHL